MAAVRQSENEGGKQMTVMHALTIAITVWIIAASEPWLAYPMISQPLVIGPIVGLILGDFTTGIMAGATLQLIFLGAMGIGGTLPPDSVIGTVIGTAYAITMGQSVEVALAFGVPIALLGSFINLGIFLFRCSFTDHNLKLCEKGDMKGLERTHIALAFLPELVRVVIIFLALYLGSGPAERLIEIIPQVGIDGLRFASGMMPAVGIALLLRMMWNKKMAVYFFAGFLLVAFLRLPVIAVACLGIVLAVVLFLETWSSSKQTASAAGGKNSAEEEMFND